MPTPALTSIVSPLRRFIAFSALVLVLPGSVFAAPTGWHHVALTLPAPAGSSLFGTALADAGDVNGDGYSDALIGAPGGYSGPRNYKGRAYLYYGMGEVFHQQLRLIASATKDRAAYRRRGSFVSIRG